MKLRGLSPNVLVVGLAVLLLGFSLFLKFKKNDLVDDMKSQLTVENSSQNKPQGLKGLIAKTIEKQEEMQEGMVERKDFDDSLLSQERFYTEKEINDMTEVQFTALVKEVELRLPKLTDIRALPPQALHRTPEPVLRAGKDLGLLKEILKVHESYSRVAVGFYQTCAKDSERPTPVRALCLTNFVEIKKKKGEKINYADYPPQLVELTKMITDL